MSFPICKSDSDFFASCGLDLHHKRWCDPELTLFYQRTGTNVCPIDITVCMGENGHDDDEEGGYPERTRYVGRVRIYTHENEDVYFADLPIDHAMQGYCGYMLKGELKGWSFIIQLGVCYSRNEEEVNMGVDKDLKEGTDLTLRL